jgi:hypothetical protein
MQHRHAVHRRFAGVALVCALALVACADPAPHTDATAPLSPATAAEAAGFTAPVPALMGLLTGRPFDAERGCWPSDLAADGAVHEICLRPGLPASRPQDGRERVFLHAYALPESGRRRGVFAAIVAESATEGGWRAVAKLRGLPAGNEGDCGCSDAELRRMGRDRWGWVFAARDGGQRRFHAVMSSSAGLSQVARVPVPEDGIDGLRHRVEFDVRDENAEAFALLHVVLRGVQPVDVRTHPFDTALGRYFETPVRPGG